MRDEHTVALNRRARHDFTIDDTFEAGIVLTGTEIKSIRAGKVNLPTPTRASRTTRRGSSAPTSRRSSGGNRYNHEPKRTRKLLLHRSEIDELLGRTKAKGQTIVPLRLYISRQGPGQGRARAGARQAAPRPAPRHRRPRREARRRARAGRRPARPLGGDASVPDRLRLGPVIEAVDAHAAGEPGRVIVGGVEDVPGATMFDKMTWLAGQPRRPAAADAARAARLPGGQLQPDPAVDPPGRRRRLRDHGAGRVPGHVRHEHDVRRDRRCSRPGCCR